MEKNRLEAFSDGVIAIIITITITITIMVLEMKVPHGADIAALAPLAPVFLSYVLSFVYVGIYWNNHHHMLQLTETVYGAILWANLHLLFWLWLLPVAPRITSAPSRSRELPRPLLAADRARLDAAVLLVVAHRVQPVASARRGRVAAVAAFPAWVAAVPARR